MTDAELIARLREGATWDDDIAAADRIEQLVATNEALTKERERLALAICGGEDAPGYANAQTVETLEKVARDWGVAMLEQINRTLVVETKLAKAVERLTNLEKSASEVSRYGAATGPQWTKMSIAILAARATLAELTGNTP